MRQFILTVHLILCFLCKESNAQINLVPNPSFEDTIPCTSGSIGTSLAATGWSAIYGSPDYYNSVYASTCGYNVSGLPTSSNWGSQMPLDGNAYVGYSTYCNPGICGPNNREAIQAQLTSAFITNKKYLISFFVNLASNCDYATDDIGVYFSASSSIPFPAPAQFYNPSGNFIIDTVNWTLISGVIIATGGEQYINIGNFKNDASTTVTPNNPPSWSPTTYYFTDMVSVYELPDIEAGISDSICLGDTVQLNATCSGIWGGLQYRWFPSSGLSDTTILNPIALPTATTTYYFGLIDTTGTIPGMINYVDSLTIVVGCTGVEEYHNDTFGKIYPNPANTIASYEIELKNNETGVLELFDLLGNKVRSKKLNPGKSKTLIDLSDLANGTYVYKVFIDNEYKASNKIIITK